jgi:peptidoglycan/xylan/chitin deacetylase (PgdA/CDA1 family)
LKTDSKPNTRVSILMYHSISDSPGPTNIAPETFRDQIETLAACGYRAIPLEALVAWQTGEADLPARSIVITFDDGFADFAECAFPILADHGYTATVFLPTGKIGGSEDWDGAHGTSARKLMTWSQIIDLTQANVDFGGHSVNHVDLTRLPVEALQREIRQCRDHIEQRTGRTPVAFAPPYGRSGQRERDEIQKCFKLAVGTRLERTNPHSERYDLPRIEMHYFRDIQRWHAMLQERAEWYFRARRVCRNLKRLATLGLK